jgi:hypothetical protein
MPIDTLGIAVPIRIDPGREWIVTRRRPVAREPQDLSGEQTKVLCAGPIQRVPHRRVEIAIGTKPEPPAVMQSVRLNVVEDRHGVHERIVHLEEPDDPVDRVASGSGRRVEVIDEPVVRNIRVEGDEEPAVFGEGQRPGNLLTCSDHLGSKTHAVAASEDLACIGNPVKDV